MQKTVRNFRRCLPLLLLLLAIPAAAQEPTPAVTPPAHVGRQVSSPGNADWAVTAADARARATAQKKLVYYEFESPKCGGCRRMQALQYPAFDFEALLIGMVPVKLQIDSAEGKELAKLYSISETPAVLIATPEGRLVFLMQSFKDIGDFYRHVHKDLDSYRRFAAHVDAQDIATLPADEAYFSGRELYQRFDFAGARPRLKRASVAPDATPALRDNALEVLAATELQLGSYAEARKTIDKVIATTKDPALKERAELFRPQIALSENNLEEALKLYKRFEKEHPNSKYLDKVRSFIAQLEPSEPAR
jgi:tetratricopeptide (TPR) repeat protein